MSTESPYDERTRTTARSLAERLRSDPGFRAQVEADPVGVLRAAGLPEEATDAFLQEVGIEGEVQGYGKCNVSCDVWASSGGCILTL